MQSQQTEYKDKVWLVGGSQGIGLSLTEILLNNSYLTLVSSRNCESNQELLKLKQQYPDQLFLMDLDVTNSENIAAKVFQAWNILGGIDIWFYNAGSYDPMPIQEWKLEKFISMNQVNYIGCVQLMIELRDKFLKQGHGRWIWNISLASDFGLPYGGGYSAPKAGLLNLAESLQPELKAHNIQLQVVNHGFVKTRLTAKNDFPMLGLMEPQQAAEKIFSAFNSEKFETRFPFNLASILGLIKRLPKSWSLALTKKMLKHE